MRKIGQFPSRRCLHELRRPGRLRRHFHRSLVLFLSLFLAPFLALTAFQGSALADPSPIVVTGASVHPTGETSSTGATSTATSSTTNQAYTPSVYTPPAVTNTTYGVQNNGQNAGQQQGNGANAGALAAGVMAGMAAMTCGKPGMQALCIGSLLGAAAGLMTAANMSNAQNQSAGQVASVTPAYTSSANPSVTTSPAYTTTLATLHAAARAADAKLSSDMKKITLADGRTVDVASAVSDGSGSGLSSSEMGALKDALQKGQAAIKAGGLDGMKGVKVNDDGAGGDSGGGLHASNGSSDAA
ncbi:MAG: hypothetical protein C5B49_14225, partial [Bdellovibrio sp.]